MALSREVQSAVDEIRRNKSLSRSLLDANKLLGEQIASLKSRIDAIPVEQEISKEDKEALQKEVAELDALNDELEGATKANTQGGGNAGSSGGGEASGGDNPKNKPIPPVGAEGHPTEPLTEGDVLAANGPANHPAGGTVPLMPNMAFNPDPTGARGVGDAGQPNQPAAIETAGGFVVSGGGTTQRAPGSRPESPSSSQIVPLDPDAKGAASTADEVKSGLGDSSQNALLGNDGRPVSEGPGMPKEPSDAERERAQKQADLVEQERQRREENPLNLAEPGTPQAGSAEADKEALKRRQEEQRAAQDAERDRNASQSGKPEDGAPGPDPVSGPVETSEQRAVREAQERNIPEGQRPVPGQVA